ncbi:run domain Beclin-1-interacting and cysteine-rich domain-containing protein-like [Clytia hemisphaerica]|uniref:Rubicon Homology domain-containing protein n=1 Tax=Clytia hemisphaerica TaxID=252671 RepID=A0A7M5XJ50_9CNID
MDEEEITNELYSCFNSIRSTVEGIIPYNSDGNIWNIPGSLKRVKKASYQILTNGLRENVNSNNVDEEDKLKELCLKLIPSSGNDSIDDLDSSQDMLLDWLEKHLLANSILDCVKNLFLETWSEKTLSSYKEYSYVKNEDLMQAYIACLESLQQGNMSAFMLIKPSLLNRSTFIEELRPWVTSKAIEENEFLKAQEQQIESENCFGLYSQQEDTGAISDDKLSDHKDIVYNQNPILVDNASNKPSPIPSDLLMNSALTAVNDIQRDECPEDWYIDANTERARLLLRRETSRSESSIYHEDEDGISSHTSSNASDSLQGLHSDSTLESHQRIQGSASFSHKKRQQQQQRKGHSRSKSDQIGIHHNQHHNTISMMNQMNMELSLPGVSLSLPKEMDTTDGLSSSQQSHSPGYYRYDDVQLVPRPYEGQSLFSYLDSRNYDTGAQLDKENAHFSICEALITAIEEMRCQRFDRMSSKRRRTILNNDNDLAYDSGSTSVLSDVTASSGASSCHNKSSATLPSSSDALTDDACISDSAFPTMADQRRSIGMSWENVSVSPRRLKREISESEKPEIIQSEEIPPNDFSAEAVAKSLLHKFQGHKLPAASELKWIVSELEAPQELLPLPTAWPISPDSHLTDNPPERHVQSGMGKSMPSLLRGNFEWAPPRLQIIFVPHPFVKRKVMLQRQHYRCAGCGLKVSPDLSKRFRYCEYLGKYFCTSCHQKAESVIPAKILSKWDFKRYFVSDFARDLLKKIHRDPLFNVHDISPNLYDRVRPLNTTKNLRVQLHYMKKFLDSCRYAESCQKEVMKLPMHISDDPHVYSIDDLIQVKNGELHKTLSGVITRGDKHIKEDCQVCQLKGFICEVCSSDEILYPFELRKVHVCQSCKTCSHRSCYVKGSCKRCERIKARKLLVQADLPESPELE